MGPAVLHPNTPPRPPPRSDPSSAQAGSANRLIFARVWGLCSVGFYKWLDCFILQIASFILLCSCLPAASLSCVIISRNSLFVLSPVGVPYWYLPVLCFWRCHGGKHSGTFTSVRLVCLLSFHEASGVLGAKSIPFQHLSAIT